MKRTILLLVFIYAYYSGLASQNEETVLELSLQDVIELAQKQSPDILNARHAFLSKYWAYVSYKANYLPSLNFSTSPTFDHALNSITQDDGKEKYISQNILKTNATLSIDQNVALTGGELSLYTSLGRNDDFDTGDHIYKSIPIRLSYKQSLFGYNAMKWDKIIEPMRFEEAKKNYVETRELVAYRAVTRFFNLAITQSNLKSARTNYENSKTLYSYAQGRYNIGTISENEMLQLEINMLSDESSLMTYTNLLDDYMEALRSYLRLSDTSVLSLIVDDRISLENVNQFEALQQALENSPDIIYMERIKKESDSNVAYVEGNTGFKADLTLEFGLAGSDKNFKQAYRDFDNEQKITVGISFPILDWGRDRGRIKVAKSSRDLVYAQAEQDRQDFEMNVIKLVKQFNLQPNTLRIAYKQEQTAEKRSEVARNLYMTGKSTILDLNASITEKDDARRNYINAISNYWLMYYSLRMSTLYDFEKDMPITEDYKKLLE